MRRFGDILVEEGLIEEDELKKALTLQRKSAYKLGQILIKKGLISEEDALMALSKQYEMEYAEKLEPKNIEQLTDKVPLKFVQKYRVVPYYIEDAPKTQI
jgi:general secretion pathway protein E